MNHYTKTSLLKVSAFMVAMVLPIQSQAIVFEFNDIGGANIGSNARTGFEEAAAIWSGLFQDNIVVRLDIGFSSLGAGILGSNSSNVVARSYSDIKTLLNNDRTSTADFVAVANLQAGNSLTAVTNVATPGSVDTTQTVIDNDGSTNNRFLAITQANAKAIGFADTGATDATITFSSDFLFDFDRSNGIDSNRFDFVGVALHEIGHSLGFSSGVDTYDILGSPDGSNVGALGTDDLNNFAVSNIIDLYRYQNGVLDWSVGGNPYFSVDGGATNLATFSSGNFNGDGRQASHWEDNLGLGILDPTFAPGEFGQISTLDLFAFDVIGYDLQLSVVPEPTVLALLGLSFASFGFSRKKRKI